MSGSSAYPPNGNCVINVLHLHPVHTSIIPNQNPRVNPNPNPDPRLHLLPNLTVCKLIKVTVLETVELAHDIALETFLSRSTSTRESHYIERLVIDPKRPTGRTDNYGWIIRIQVLVLALNLPY